MSGLRDGMGPPAEPARASARLGWWCFETTTPLTAGTYAAARSAVDCAVAATDAVLGGAPLAYGLCRPPGHHATTSLYGGYCFFNNAAIAAVHAGTAWRRAGRRARRRLPPRQRHAADLLRARRRGVRVVARRSGAGVPVPDRATPTRPGPGGAGARRRNIPLAAGTDDDGYLAALEPGARRGRRVRPGARRRVARRRHLRRRPDVRPRRHDGRLRPDGRGGRRRSAVRSSCSRRAATPTTPSAPTSRPGCAARPGLSQHVAVRIPVAGATAIRTGTDRVRRP